MTKEEAIAYLKSADVTVGREVKTKTAEALEMAINALEERKTGRWILAEMGDTDLYECSLCKTRKTYKPPFCPQCGAKMEGAEE